MFLCKKPPRQPDVVLTKAPPAPVRLCVLTWNVGNAEPSDDMTALLGPKGGGDFDVYFVGLQECEYTPANPQLPVQQAGDNAHLKKKVTKIAHHFLQLVQVHLGDDFFAAGIRELGEMKAAVFAREGLREQIKNVVLAGEATGLMHVVDNKGGIAVKFDIGNITMGFISCHLAAHEGDEYKQRRVADIMEILRGTQGIGDGLHDVANQFHHLIWVGDLNFRMDVRLLDPAFETLSHEEKFAKIKDHVEKKDWAKLAQADELREEIKHDRIFCGFSEGEMPFEPTFKVERKTHLEYKNQRVPAYCDRVLWRSFPECRHQLEQLSLEPLITVGTSDHKPVRSAFKLSFPEPKRENPLDDKRAKLRGYYVIFHELACRGLPEMDKVGSADPYILFNSEELFGRKKKYRTKVIQNTLNPTWKRQDLPMMPTRWTHKESVLGSHITCRIFDKDVISDDDLIGTVLIDFEGADAANGKEFSLPINKYGVKRGILKGRVSIVPAEGTVSAL